MTADEYRAVLKQLDLTQAAAATFLGIEEVTSRRWATGKSRVHGAAEKLLRLMIAMKLTPEQVSKCLDDQPAGRVKASGAASASAPRQAGP
ncbi:helix-turn-helix domain-containing protein [Methylobacterium nigriterrae]|uniref:helix-turn-helix domain-containing protein n=1 Tax=Methylobacterium nigriterrae TaxID=3127512 RepID=UPI003013D829